MHDATTAQAEPDAECTEHTGCLDGLQGSASVAFVHGADRVLEVGTLTLPGSLSNSVNEHLPGQVGDYMHSQAAARYSMQGMKCVCVCVCVSCTRTSVGKPQVAFCCKVATQVRNTEPLCSWQPQTLRLILQHANAMLNSTATPMRAQVECLHCRCTFCQYSF
jgi:hypothetical protein